MGSSEAAVERPDLLAPTFWWEGDAWHLTRGMSKTLCGKKVPESAERKYVTQIGSDGLQKRCTDCMEEARRQRDGKKAAAETASNERT